MQGYGDELYPCTFMLVQEGEKVLATEEVAITEITLTFPRWLLQEAEQLAWEMDLSLNEVIHLALEELIKQEAPFSEERIQIAKADANYPDEGAWQEARHAYSANV